MLNLNVEFKRNGIIKIWSKQYPFVCFTIPRASVSTAIPEIETNMGVYFLINTDEGKIDQNGNYIKRKVYIGKTANGMSRFFNHKATKEWWNKICFFTASNLYFDEDTILGLENLLIRKYKQSNLYIMNQENSARDIDDDCKLLGEQIISIMNYLEYPLHNYGQHSTAPLSQEIANNSNAIGSSIDEFIADKIQLKKLLDEIQAIGYSCGKDWNGMKVYIPDHDIKAQPKITNICKLIFETDNGFRFSTINEWTEYAKLYFNMDDDLIENMVGFAELENLGYI